LFNPSFEENTRLHVEFGAHAHIAEARRSSGGLAQEATSGRRQAAFSRTRQRATRRARTARSTKRSRSWHWSNCHTWRQRTSAIMCTSSKTQTWSRS
jgi:hypothetical protein